MPRKPAKPTKPVEPSVVDEIDEYVEMMLSLNPMHPFPDDEIEEIITSLVERGATHEEITEWFARPDIEEHVLETIEDQHQRVMRLLKYDT